MMLVQWRRLYRRPTTLRKRIPEVEHPGDLADAPAGMLRLLYADASGASEELEYCEKVLKV